MAEKKKKYKTIQIYFSEDDELDMQIYNVVQNTKIVGMTINGLTKKLYYDALIAGKTSTDIVSADITVVQNNNDERITNDVIKRDSEKQKMLDIVNNF